jgi:hypothetical protein
MLGRISGNKVTRNYAEKSINSILNKMSKGVTENISRSGCGGGGGGATGSSSSSSSSSSMEEEHKATTGDQLSAFFDAALTSLTAGGAGSSLAFNTRLRLARIHLSTGNWAPLKEVLSVLLAACEGGAGGGGGGGSQEQVTSLMEVYSIQMQMYSALGENKHLSELVEKAKGKVKAAVSTPSVSGVICECSGKVMMADKRWEDARVAFSSAFHSFEEAGNRDRTLANLSYYVLCNMLSGSRISPFEGDETAKSYERNPAMEFMVKLSELYMSGDHMPFTARVTAYATSPSSDPFIRTYLDELLFAIKSTAALKIVSSYSRVSIDFVAKELGACRTLDPTHKAFPAPLPSPHAHPRAPLPPPPFSFPPHRSSLFATPCRLGPGGCPQRNSGAAHGWKAAPGCKH